MAQKVVCQRSLLDPVTLKHSSVISPQVRQVLGSRDRALGSGPVGASGNHADRRVAVLLLRIAAVCRQRLLWSVWDQHFAMRAFACSIVRTTTSTLVVVVVVVAAELGSGHDDLTSHGVLLPFALLPNVLPMLVWKGRWGGG